MTMEARLAALELLAKELLASNDDLRKRLGVMEGRASVMDKRVIDAMENMRPKSTA